MIIFFEDETPLPDYKQMSHFTDEKATKVPELECELKTENQEVQAGSQTDKALVTGFEKSSCNC